MLFKNEDRRTFAKGYIRYQTFINGYRPAESLTRILSSIHFNDEKKGKFFYLFFLTFGSLVLNLMIG
jgi:hypothetical protein